MQWFKHDSDANRDAKLKRLMIKYGMEGYGLYWYCLELIAADVTNTNVTFELEHDSEIIAHDTGIHYQRVEEMIMAMVELGLFNNQNGVITCLKMAKRLDQSMTSNPKMREMIKQIKQESEQQTIDKIGQSHDGVMMESCQNHDTIMQDKIRLDKNKPYVSAKAPTCPTVEIINLYHEKLPKLPKVITKRFIGSAREKDLRARWREDELHQTLEFWERLFTAINRIDFYMGENDRNWRADLGWFLKRENFDKTLQRLVNL